MTDQENYQTLEMAGPTVPVKKNIQQSVENRNKTYHKASRYDQYKFPQKSKNLDHLKINLDDSLDRQESAEVFTSLDQGIDDPYSNTRFHSNQNQLSNNKGNITENQVSSRSKMQQNSGMDEAFTPRYQPKLKFKIIKSKLQQQDKPNLQGSSQNPNNYLNIDAQEINKKMNQQSLAEGSESGSNKGGLGGRISTFDADAMEADTDLLLGDLMQSDAINHNANLPVRNFEGTLASHILQDHFQDTSLIGDQNYDLRDPEGILDNEEFDKDDYDTRNMAIDEGEVGDRVVQNKKNINLKKQLSEIQSKIQNKLGKQKQNQQIMGSTYLQGSQNRSSLIGKNNPPNLDEVISIQEALGRSDNPLRKINQNLVDYKIVFINIGSGNEQELRLSPKQFEFIPRDLLQYLGKWSKLFKNGENEQNITSIDLSQNNIQEIEGSLFMHLGKEGCQNIRSILAQKNHIKCVSSRIKDCVNLQTLKLSNNQLTGREFLPTEVLNNTNFCQSLEFLYLSNNDIRELPIQLNSLKNLKVLNLENNKIRTLSYKQNSTDDDDDDNKQIVCSISGLESLEEIYLGQNRLKDLPTIFHNFRKLKILGLDWFTYIAQPLTLPKIVEDQVIIQKFKRTCQYNKEEKKNQYITFRQFAKGFSDNGKYNIDDGQRIQEDGRTSLHLAVIKNDQAMVNNLLKDGSDPNLLDNYQYSPLGLALTHNLINISKLILKFSQKINFKTAENSRLLLLSVEKLDIDLTEELLRQGCDPNLTQDVKSGENCLHLLVFKLSCANENVLIRAENTIQEEKYSQSEKKISDQTPIVTDRDGNKSGHLKTYTDERNGLSETKHNGFGDTSIYFNDHKKCLRILDSLLLHGMKVNQQCNQKYTPFLLAVRLGNVFLTQKLLQRLVANSKVSRECNGGEVDPNRQIDLDLKGGFGLNTAYHLAATRTNFDILYELDKYGADVFARNKDNKTAFQLVNNNLLMLKIVKKIEKKQILRFHIKIIEKIQPPECKIVVHNNIYVNTSEYKQFDETLQKLKQECLKAPQDRRRTSLFSGQKRGSSQGGSLTRLNLDQQTQQSSKRSNVHKPKDKMKKPKKLYIVDFFGENEKDYEKPVIKQKTREELKQQLLQMTLSPRDSDRIMLSLQLNNGRIPQNMPKIKNMTLNKNKSTTVIKLSNLNIKGLTRVDSSDIIETDRFAVGINGLSGKKVMQKNAAEREKKTQHKLNNFSQSEINIGDEKMDLNLNNYNMNNKALHKNNGISHQQNKEKLNPINLNSSQRISSMIPPPSPFGLKAQQLSVIFSNDESGSMGTKAMFNQNHKNIFFIKDQMFDKERIKQVNNNLNAQLCYCPNDPMYINKQKERQIQLLNIEQEAANNYHQTDNNISQLECTQVINTENSKKLPKDDREVLEYQILPIFRDALNFGIQGNRQIQEIKLFSQLKSIFNPNLKTHINVLSEIIEKLYKLKSSRFIIIQILEMSAQCLQVIEFTKKNCCNLNSGKIEMKNRQAQYSFITIRAALENLQQNINCPCWIQEEIQEVIQVNEIPIKRTFASKREDITITEANDEPYNIFPISSTRAHNVGNCSDEEFPDALPSQHMMKYSKLNSSEKKVSQNQNNIAQHFNGPVKNLHPNKRVSAMYYQGIPKANLEQNSSVFGVKKNSHQSNHSQQIVDLNNKIKSSAFSSHKNSMVLNKQYRRIHHKNKNPLTHFPNTPEKSIPDSQNQTIQTETVQADNIIQSNDAINTNDQAQITLAQIREKQKRINDVYKRFDDEFNKNMTIEHEADFQVANSSPKKMKLKQFDPEKTQTQQLSSMVNLTSFQKAKFNSNKHTNRASDLLETDFIVNNYEKQSQNAAVMKRSDSNLFEEQKAYENSKHGEKDRVLDTIVVKRKNINFKRNAIPEEGAQQKLKIKIKNTDSLLDGTTSKGSKKILKTISSKKLNIQNIQSTQFIPSSKNSPREPDQEKHFRKNSRIDEVISGVAKFQEIKNSETNMIKVKKNHTSLKMQDKNKN